MSDQVTNVVADVHTALEYAVHDLTHQDGDGSTIENKNLCGHRVIPTVDTTVIFVCSDVVISWSRSDYEFCLT